jgi:hypothetical protein
MVSTSIISDYNVVSFQRCPSTRVTDTYVHKVLRKAAFKNSPVMNLMKGRYYYLWGPTRKPVTCPPNLVSPLWLTIRPLALKSNFPLFSSLYILVLPGCIVYEEWWVLLKISFLSPSPSDIHSWVSNPTSLRQNPYALSTAWSWCT